MGVVPPCTNPTGDLDVVGEKAWDGGVGCNWGDCFGKVLVGDG